MSQKIKSIFFAFMFSTSCSLFLHSGSNDISSKYEGCKFRDFLSKYGELPSLEGINFEVFKDILTYKYPLHISAFNNWFSLVQYCVEELNVDLNKKHEGTGKTALDFAKDNNNREIAYYLEARMNQRNKVLHHENISCLYFRLCSSSCKS